MSQKRAMMDRRQILLGIPAGALFCLGCRDAIAPSEDAVRETTAEKHKFLTDAGMTVEQVFQYAYTSGSIPLLKNLAKEMEPDKFIEMLAAASSRNMEDNARSIVKDLPSRDFATFSELNKKGMAQFPLSKAVTYEITEETDRSLEFKHSECLFAKTFRDADAADIGHAVFCSATPAFAHTFNPKISVTNPKNLMKGDEVCIERFVLEV